MKYSYKLHSAAGEFNDRDIWASLRDGVIVALAIGGVAVLDHLDAIDFGDWEGLATGLIATGLVFLRRVVKNYSPDGPPEGTR